ncbi:MAG: SDR family oxidoreductase [Clostridia bacterium]|nr:SDR family oxidoreductase [Clostridia bacterium]
MSKKVWITGASSGLGLHTARALEEAGFCVVKGARSYADEKKRTDGLCLPLDVTSEESVKGFVDNALALTGVPDVLIHCAGVLNLGACESYEDAEIRLVMETNFFGLTRMVRHVLPLMRERKQGRIVAFSSINGLLGIPWEGAYTASKHAMEGYLECLRMEVRPFGIEVMAVEPGDHSSGSTLYRRHGKNMTEENPYFARYQKGIAVIAHDEENGSSPEKLGKKIARALKKKRLPGKMCIAKWDQHMAVMLHDLLPAKLFSRFISMYYKQ